MFVYYVNISDSFESILKGKINIKVDIQFYKVIYQVISSLYLFWMKRDKDSYIFIIASIFSNLFYQT